MHSKITYLFGIALFLLIFSSSSACYAEGLGKCLSLERGSSAQLQCLEAFGEKGTPSDQYKLAKLFYEGDEVPLDYSEVEKWLLASAERGCPDSQVTLGTVYLESIVASASYEKSERWFQKAAENGCLVAQLQLARLLLKKDDTVNALSWIMIGSARANSIALNDSLQYISSAVLPRDREAALKQAQSWLASHPKNKNFSKEGFYELE